MEWRRTDWLPRVTILVAWLLVIVIGLRHDHSAPPTAKFPLFPPHPKHTLLETHFLVLETPPYEHSKATATCKMQVEGRK